MAKPKQTEALSTEEILATVEDTREEITGCSKRAVASSIDARVLYPFLRIWEAAAICGEAVWIKETDPKVRINNKEEYHQPGDVDIIYAKNGQIEDGKNQKRQGILWSRESSNESVI